jgi:NADH dehydrogenase (ubiquinone) 1 alpha/beta subcomplex 1, acyl-carrier protein
MAAAAARSLLLRHLRVPAAPSAASVRPVAALWGRRWMSSDDSKGSFLDKGEVTDRTVKVVKNFPKIEDPSKVYAVALVPSLPCGCLERPMLASIKSAIKMLSAPIWMLLPFLFFFVPG